MVKAMGIEQALIGEARAYREFEWMNMAIATMKSFRTCLISAALRSENFSVVDAKEALENPSYR